MTALSVFIHSTGTTSAMWASVPPDVWGDTVRLAPTNLGYPPREPLARGAVCTAADDAAHLATEIGDGEGDVHLYAHSYGASVALDLAGRLGARVRSLFLFEPVLFGALARDAGSDPDAVAEAHAFRDHPWFLHDAERGGTEPWLEHFIDYWNRPGSWARMPEPMKAATRAVAWKMYQEVRSCFFDVNDFAERPIPRVPCTLVRAERSTKAARAMALALARRNPHAQLVELPGVGHMAVLTNPTAVHDAMRTHAARVRAARS